MSNVAREAVPVTASFICFVSFYFARTVNQLIHTTLAWSLQRHGKPSMFLTLGNVYCYKFLKQWTFHIESVNFRKATHNWIKTIPPSQTMTLSSITSLKVIPLQGQFICKVWRKITEQVRYKVDKIQLLVAITMFNISIIKNFSIIKITF